MGEGEKNEETALKLKITVDGKVYEVEVDVSELESLIVARPDESFALLFCEPAARIHG